MASSSLLRIAELAAFALTLCACGRHHAQTSIAPASAVTAPLPPVAAAPPPAFVQTTSDVRATRIVDLREGLTKTVAFRAATDLLAQNYAVDVSDQKAGFLMTPWQSGTRQGAPDFRYRTRVIIRFLGTDWKQASVRADANWQRADEWDIGVDTKLLDDVATDLTARIGKR